LRRCALSAKRNPQTAAKRAREQALREKREIKASKKRAAALAKKEPPPSNGSTVPLEHPREEGGESARI
jgi:hypothetical protein